jgi:hypothetical protein
MDKSTTLKAFNTLFFSFLNDIISVFPENNDIVIAKKSFETIKQLNVSLIVKTWYTFVYSQYKQQIIQGDLSFFIDKDYNTDLTQLSNSREIMETIDKLRDPIRQMTPENKQSSLLYIQKLSQLSENYMLFK